MLLTVLTYLSAGPTLQARDFQDSQFTHIHYPDWFKDSLLDLQEDINEAREDDKLGLMVLFTTDGCSYCDVFIRRSLGDQRLASLLKAHFHAVGLEIFNDAEMVGPRGEALRVKEFAKREGAGFSPTLLFFGENGSLLYRGVGYHSPARFRLVLDYLVDGHYLQSTFRDYTARRQAGFMSQDASYRLRPNPQFDSPPYALDRTRFPAERPLLVIFEAEGCEECPILHDEVLSVPEVRELMGRFDVVRLDARDSKTPVLAPDGARTTPTDWFAATGFSRLPALLFFDEKGREVLRTDALVLRQRMMNSLRFTLERAYEKDWTFQRFARSKAVERMQR